MSSIPIETYSAKSYRKIFEMLFMGFVLSGVVGSLNAPVLPTFISRWSLDDSSAGFFFTAMYLGSLLGTMISSVVISRGGYQPTLALGYGVVAVGIAGLNFPSYKLALAATVVYGIGYGLLVTASNLWGAEYSGTRRAAAVTLLNLAWGIGAMICPALVLYALRVGHFGVMFWGVAAGALVLAIGFVRSPFLPHRKLERDSVEEVGAPRRGTWIAVGLAFLFFVYVGTENGISGWSAAHAKRVLLAGDSSWALAPILFFFGLLAGRAMASAILLQVKEVWVVYGGLIVAAVGTLVELAAKSRIPLLAGVLVAGLGCSGVYPVFVAWLAEWFGTRARSMGGVMFSLAAIGGASLPWLVGFVSKHTDSLRIGLLVPVAGCVAMLAVTALLRPSARV
jgi:fucose permease